MWSSIKTHGSKVMTTEIPFTAILGSLCGDGEHKQVARSRVERQV